MSSSIGRILAVDDNESFLATYRILLDPLGFPLETATSADEALALLEKYDDWDLVLLDQKMQGDGGPDSGLEMVSEIRVRAPSAKIIIVTGFIEAASAKRAFAEGSFDYLEKNAILSTVLPIKVRNAMEAARERRIGALSNGSRDVALEMIWSQLKAEADRHRKGKLLEDLVALLFRSIPGFEKTETSLRLEAEEIDLLIPNESKDECWHKESQFFVGECKNWMGKVDPKELAHLWMKLETKHNRVKLGFFIALNGFTAGFETFRDKLSKDDRLIVPLNGDDLLQWIESKDRNETLKAFHRRAVGLGRRP